MIFSKHTIFSKIKDSDRYFIINTLSGNADILEAHEGKLVQSIQQKQSLNNESFINELIEKGYLITDKASDDKLFRSNYLDFVDARDNDEIQLFFVPNYSCNFACSYCYQDEYHNELKEVSFELIDAFFSYIQIEFAGRRKYITVFGGEPLLNSPKQRLIINYLIEKSNQTAIDLCFVTNGYTLADYAETLTKGRIREIQVTLDGTSAIHNSRRFLKGGFGTFDKVVAGIDACLTNKLTVNLRMVIDKENIDNLPELAQFAIDRGWTQSPYFKTQIGRNYELHHCQSAPDKLFTRISLYEKLYQLTSKNPHILEFYKPAYSISKFLAEQGAMPDPLFDSCPACKTEWAFDYSGHIFPCTATVGKTDEILGSFYPNISKNETKIADWENRDVTAIDKCKTCNMQLACGGGCGSVAKNQNGSVCSPDCRPITELLELGFAAYFENK